jgi:hypothetical protein
MELLLVPSSERVEATPQPPLCACTDMSLGDLYLYCILQAYLFILGAAVAQVVEALRYKPAGRGCHSISSLA